MQLNIYLPAETDALLFACDFLPSGSLRKAPVFTIAYSCHCS